MFATFLKGFGSTPITATGFTFRLYILDGAVIDSYGSPYGSFLRSVRAAQTEAAVL